MEELLRKIRVFIYDLQDKVSELAEENRRIFIIILSGLAALVILTVTFAAVQCSSKKTDVTIPEVYAPTDEYLYPDSIDFVDGYYFSRESKDHWTDQDIEPWFTEINEKTIDTLKDGNDSIINDLLGGVP